MIELLVVVSILSVLGYVVMADYNSEIKRSRVRIAGETLYSELQDLRVRVSSGDQTEDVFYCWGVSFGGDEVYRVYSEYVDGCDYENYSFDKEIDLGNGVSVENGEGYIFFQPPYADMQAFDLDFVELAEEITITFGDGSYSRSIYINPLTENIQLESIEE